MLRTIITLLVSFAALPAFAQCVGTDLLAEMPATEQAELRAVADAHPYPNGLLWRAERGDEMVHLVGTLHVADPRHADTFAQIKPLIERADTIFLELGEGDEARLQAKIASDPGLAFIIDGPTMPEILPQEDWDSLRAAMSDRGVPGFMAAKLKPWMLMMTVGISKCVFAELQAGKRGLDHAIMEYASDINNPAQALEDFDTAMRIFDGYSDAEMLDFLRLALVQEQGDADALHATLVEAYFREEIRLIWEFTIRQSFGIEGYTEEQVLAEAARMEDALAIQRNRNWMDRILPAAAKGEVFVAAGALHLPGDQGLLNLLKNEGFTLTRIPRLP